eukprot:162525_1
MVEPGPLPVGWTERSDPRSGKKYYQDNVSKLTSWTRPLRKDYLDRESCPDGWTVAWDDRSQKVYYKDNINRKTCWERPTTQSTRVTPVVAAKPTDNLPNGWSKTWDPVMKRWYYKDGVNKLTQWDRPTGPALLKSIDPRLKAKKKPTDKDLLMAEYEGLLTAIMIDCRISSKEAAALSKWRQTNKFDEDDHKNTLKKLGCTEEQFDKLKDFEDDVKGDDECIVCMDERKNTILFPCRHMCLCTECAGMLENGDKPECPVCRQKIEEVIRVFR